MHGDLVISKASGAGRGVSAGPDRVALDDARPLPGRLRGQGSQDLPAADLQDLVCQW